MRRSANWLIFKHFYQVHKGYYVYPYDVTHIKDRKCQCFVKIYIFPEVELSFSYRDVKIKRGVDPKEIYELESEIGR